MSGEKVDALVISGQPETLRSWRRSHYMQSVQITMAEAFDVADRGSLRWLQTLSIGNLMRMPCRGSRPPRSYAGAARIRPSVFRVRPRR